VVVQVLGQRPEVQHLEAARMACPAAVLPMAVRLVRPEAVRPVVPDAVRYPARPFAAAAQLVRVPQQAEVSVAQPLAAELRGALRPAEQPGALAEAAAEVQREEEVLPALAAQPKVAPGVLAEWDAAAGPQPVVASVAAGVRQPEEEAVPGVAAVALPQEAAQAVAAAALRQAAELAAVAALLLEVRAVRVLEVVRRRAARGVRGVLPSGAAWAAPLSIRLRGDRLAPSPAVHSAHARKAPRIARPKQPWWPAAGGEVLS
jgi:hypothetical protein